MIRSAALFAVLLLTPQEPTDSERKDFVQKGVEPAIAKGLKALRAMQEPSGRFTWLRSRGPRENGPHAGATALALYTFLSAGCPLEDPAPSKALDWLLSNPVEDLSGYHYKTYTISLTAVALSYAIPHLPSGDRREKAVARLQRAADWLLAAQRQRGGWSYTEMNDFHDHSNSQFGILGLRAAANAGVKVAPSVWEREVWHYRRSQMSDGGWSYTGCSNGRYSMSVPSSTMTAAGVMGLAIAVGSTAGTDKIATDVAIQKGFEAVRVFWKKGLDRPLKSISSVPYLLYSVERACMVAGRMMLGDVDWYVEGSWWLLKHQDQDGRWETERPDAVATQCFALLFLKRAFVPVETPSNAAGGSKPPGSATSGEQKPREME